MLIEEGKEPRHVAGVGAPRVCGPQRGEPGSEQLSAPLLCADQIGLVHATILAQMTHHNIDYVDYLERKGGAGPDGPAPQGGHLPEVRDTISVIASTSLMTRLVRYVDAARAIRYLSGSNSHRGITIPRMLIILVHLPPAVSREGVEGAHVLCGLTSGELLAPSQTAVLVDRLAAQC